MSGAPAASPKCTGQPLSWLILERHALGELPASEASRVQSHLATCGACAACAAEARRPWPLPARVMVAAGTPARQPWWRRYAAGWATTAVLACAAAGFLIVSRSPDRSGAIGPGDTLPGVKGGDATLELVRERQGEIVHGADTFAPEDRWKVLVTCPTGHVLFWDVAVRDGEGHGVRYPLAPAGPLSCGNHVALPGAFRLSGTAEATVCVTLAADPVARARLERIAATGGPLCAVVRPEK